jgi:methionine sulfoxide reductase heme-binding subunit
MVQSVVFSASLAPVCMLAWRAAHHHLGANPVEELTHVTGDWTLSFIVITLLISPLRRWAGIPDLIRFRRMLDYLDSFTAAYVLINLWLDKFFDWHDIGKRRFITGGLLGLLLMVPLALTSTSGWFRRLGGGRWQLLHRLIYVTAAAGVVDYYWLVKSDIRLPALYGVIVTILLVSRICGFTPIAANDTRVQQHPIRLGNAATGIIRRRPSLQGRCGGTCRKHGDFRQQVCPGLKDHLMARI